MRNRERSSTSRGMVNMSRPSITMGPCWRSRTRTPRGGSPAQLKAVARRPGRHHALAGRLWASGVFEARVVAAFIDEPDKVTRAQLELWARDLDSWGVCDACCCYLFRRTPF